MRDKRKKPSVRLGNGLESEEAATVRHLDFAACEPRLVSEAESVPNVDAVSASAITTIPAEAPYDNLRLAVLKRRIEKHHEAARLSCRRAIFHAVAAGRWLSAAKAKLPHGEFRAWIEAQFRDGMEGPSIRTCQRYMKIAANFPQVASALGIDGNATPTSVMEDADKFLAGISIRKALALIDEANDPRNASIDSSSSVALPCSNSSSTQLIANLPHSDGKGDSNACAIESSTASEVVDSVIRFLGSIDLDPCVGDHNAFQVPATRRYSSADEGLSIDREWSGRVFVQPPPKNASPWVARTLREFATGSISEAVLLVPADFTSDWFAEASQFPCAFLHAGLLASDARERDVRKPANPLVLIMVADNSRSNEFAQSMNEVAYPYAPLV